jgi:hypothetical protein
MSVFYRENYGKPADEVQVREARADVMQKLLIALGVNGGVILSFALIPLLITSLTGQPPVTVGVSSLVGAVAGTPLGIFAAKKIALG